MNNYPLALPTGFQVEELVIASVLGQGAFGITYLVEDKSFGVRYALKEYFPRNLATRSSGGRILSSSGGDRAAFKNGLEKFVAEGKLVAPLDHRNVVNVIRLIRYNNTAYLQMPYYRGGTLADLLNKWGKLTEGEVTALVYPLLDALRYIHSYNIVHRDIKPSNIYLKQDGEPLLIDFGAARAVDLGSAQSHTAIGSDGYAALEQASTRGRLGPWTDIYGLAATLYKIMSGEVPIPSGDRADETYHGHTDPLEPLANLERSEYSIGLRRAVDAGLGIRGTERPQSVDEWARQFRRSERAQPVVSEDRSGIPAVSDVHGQPTDTSSSVLAKEKRPWGLYASLLVFLSVLIGTAFYYAFATAPQSRHTSDRRRSW